MKIKTSACPVCHEVKELIVSADSYDMWRKGSLIQNAFPELSLDDRERLITGLHGNCWNIYLGPKEE